MSLLRDLIKDLKENAAGGATAGGDVGAYAGSLFGGGAVGRSGKRATRAHRLSTKEMKTTIKNRNKWKWRVIGEMMDEPKFDAADVMSKLDAAEKRSKVDQDTTPFGLEDEDGNIVKVFVKSEEADEFESALASMLAGEDEDEDEVNSNVEIAEILFQLKDKFTIVDVEWPQIEGDEEEEQEVGGEEGMEGGDPEGEGDLDIEGGEGDDEIDVDTDAEGEGLEGLEGEDMEMEPEGGAESALQQVIDMMKADAEARKAESEARAAEAEARAAEAKSHAAASKVKQEEEVLDMEAYNGRKKEEEEEAKRLAKLAKYKHHQASDYEQKLAAEEEEEVQGNSMDPEKNATIGKDELMQKILDYLRAN